MMIFNELFLSVSRRLFCSSEWVLHTSRGIIFLISRLTFFKSHISMLVDVDASSELLIANTLSNMLKRFFKRPISGLICS